MDDDDFAVAIWRGFSYTIDPISLFTEASSRDIDHPWISTRRRNE